MKGGHDSASHGSNASEKFDESFGTFVKKYHQRTAQSRQFMERSQKVHADKSSIAFGASPDTQPLTYPIVVDHAKGSRLVDIDGNEYIDVLQGLGANLFGHHPDFVRDAIAAQVEKGFPIGVQMELVEEVARQVTTLTGMPRVCFSNTGTEAVMTAIRVARGKTGKDMIAVFADSYHGHSDTVLMRASMAAFIRKRLRQRFANRKWLAPLARWIGPGQITAAPASIGIPRNIAKDMMVLEYGNPRSLEIIHAKRHRLAAVLVEPVQSRCPELQPREFLHSLREVTASSQVALIFDEMVTGFRVHPGGAQGYFGIESDLATYSKIVGGGLPLSVIAGREGFMNMLQPTDPQVPVSKTTFFAGTFCKHPLALAASYATLKRITDEGPVLQEGLNQKTGLMVQRLNNMTASEGFPVRFTHFGSFFSMALSQSKIAPAAINRLSYDLLYNGIFLRGGDRGGFLTTSHSDQDIDTIVETWIRGLRRLAQSGHLACDIENRTPNKA